MPIVSWFDQLQGPAPGDGTINTAAYHSLPSTIAAPVGTIFSFSLCPDATGLGGVGLAWTPSTNPTGAISIGISANCSVIYMARPAGVTSLANWNPPPPGHSNSGSHLLSSYGYSPLTTTTTLAADALSHNFGTPFTLTATVTGGQSPTGTVSFYDNGSLLGTSPLIAGVATLVLSPTFSAGVHTPVNAIYNGDSLNATSTSNNLTLTVLIGTTTVLTADSLTHPFGTPFVLTGTVSGNSPTGTVTFFEGSTVLGSATLVGGAAVLSNVLLPIGIHVVHAVYNGDSTNQTSISNSLTLTVTTAQSIAARGYGSHSTTRHIKTHNMKYWYNEEQQRKLRHK